MPSRPVTLLSESLSSSFKTLVGQTGVIVNTLSVLVIYPRNDFVVSSDSIASTSLGSTSEKCSFNALEISVSFAGVSRPITKVFTRLHLDLAPQTSFTVLHSFL